MKTDFFALYDALIAGVGSGRQVTGLASGSWWTMAQTDCSAGLAMTTPGDSIAPLLPGGIVGLPLDEAASAVKSWNQTEAGCGLAAINAWYNTADNMAALSAAEPFENYCTRGLDFSGRTVGLIGHLNGPAHLRQQARRVYIIEKHPQPGDYPDSACDYILPQCDIVLITGSSLVNKTLPHLLELCSGAYTVLTGPSVPLCPALLDFGIDRIAGMVVADRPAMLDKVRRDLPGSPYPFGAPFMLTRREHN